MYEIDHELTEDEFVCQNCQTILDKEYRRQTEDGEGCTECTTPCQLCGELHFVEMMYDCPYYGRICTTCQADDDYKKDVRDSVIKGALRCYFDTIEHPRVERTIIKIARQMGYDNLALEMKNDL